MPQSELDPKKVLYPTSQPMTQDLGVMGVGSMPNHGPGRDMTSAEKLVVERDSIYHEAHQLTGIVLNPIADNVMELLLQHPRLFTDWFMCVNKLMRLLQNPTHVDSWLDIQGYAQLAIDQLPTPGTVTFAKGK